MNYYKEKNKLLLKKYILLKCINLLQQFQESRLLYGMVICIDIVAILVYQNKNELFDDYFQYGELSQTSANIKFPLNWIHPFP